MSAWLLAAGVPTWAQVGTAVSSVSTDELSRSGRSLEDLWREVQQLKQKQARRDATGTDSPWSLGGYGEIHANLNRGSNADKIDIHRLVMYVGYEFSDWISFHSETELEHAWTDDGYVLLEQGFIDFQLDSRANVRAGRVLTPVGIINQRHEPTLFNGVERPSVESVIIPSTWSSDGIGLFGQLCPATTYEVYVVGGMNGDNFTSSGIRDGRIKGRQSLSDLAVTGRLDVRPDLGPASGGEQSLRFGLSGYYSGLDNTQNGGGNGKDGDMTLLSADFEFSVEAFDFRGVFANTHINGAADLGGSVAENLVGWYLEGAYHWWPDAWRQGRLQDTDATVFVRFEQYDTQDDMPAGLAADPTQDIEQWTVGVNVWLVPGLVLKADAQFRSDAAGSDLNDLFNAGIGWTF